MLVAGPTSCGKSTFVFQLLRDRKMLFDRPPDQVVYSLPPNQEIHFPKDIENDPEIVLHEGIPTFNDYKDGKSRLLIIDDQMQDCKTEVVALFTRGSHHFNVSVIVLTQNIFFSSPGFRTMSLNSHYLVLFKNPRAMDQVSCLARQVAPNNSKFFVESYLDACEKPHSYILLDMTQSCDDMLRFRSKIFIKDSDCTTVYVPIDKYQKSK